MVWCSINIQHWASAEPLLTKGRVSKWLSFQWSEHVFSAHKNIIVCHIKKQSMYCIANPDEMVFVKVFHMTDSLRNISRQNYRVNSMCQSWFVAFIPETVLKPYYIGPCDICSNIKWVTPLILIIFCHYLYYRSRNPWVCSSTKTIPLGKILWPHEISWLMDHNYATRQVRHIWRVMP